MQPRGVRERGRREPRDIGSRERSAHEHHHHHHHHHHATRDRVVLARVRHRQHVGRRPGRPHRTADRHLAVSHDRRRRSAGCTRATPATRTAAERSRPVRGSTRRPARGTPPQKVVGAGQRRVADGAGTPRRSTGDTRRSPAAGCRSARSPGRSRSPPTTRRTPTTATRTRSARTTCPSRCRRARGGRHARRACRRRRSASCATAWSPSPRSTS